MVERGKVIKGIEVCLQPGSCRECPYHRVYDTTIEKCAKEMMQDALELLKEQGEVIASLALNKENAEQTRESVKPTVDKLGNAYCVCGEHVGFFPQIHKELPEVRFNYCHTCGRKLVWE